MDLIVNVPEGMLRPVQKQKERAPAPNVGEEIAVLAAQLTNLGAPSTIETPTVVT